MNKQINKPANWQTGKLANKQLTSYKKLSKKKLSNDLAALTHCKKKLYQVAGNWLTTALAWILVYGQIHKYSHTHTHTRFVLTRKSECLWYLSCESHCGNKFPPRSIDRSADGPDYAAQNWVLETARQSGRAFEERRPFKPKIQHPTSNIQNPKTETVLESQRLTDVINNWLADWNHSRYPLPLTLPPSTFALRLPL